MRPIFRFFAPLIATILLILPAQASVLVTSMGKPNVLAFTIDDLNWRAGKFQAAGSSLDVSSIEIRGQLNAGSGGDLIARIYSHHVSDRPDVAIGGTFDISSFTGGPSDFLFPINTPGSTVLSAGTTYWLVLGTTNASFDMSWTCTNVGGSDSGPGTIFETISTCSDCNVGGTSWTTVSSPTLTDFPKFAVNVVPEPSTYAAIFGLFSLVAVIGMRFIQQRKLVTS